MGSKAALLRGKLGSHLLEYAADADRFVDLFSGSAAVAHYVAEQVPVPVLSVDPQSFSAPLALAILGRTEQTDSAVLLAEWIKVAQELVTARPDYDRLVRASRKPSRTSVTEARRLSRSSDEASGFILRHYGGHYYSPLQAASLDALYAHMPSEQPARSLALAALIRTASQCAAAPGHTAQPFQPRPTLLTSISNAWSRDAFATSALNVDKLASRYALIEGHAQTATAEAVVPHLSPGDLVFCDPPYSDVQYSRFYHVLEGISCGGWESVSGAGRAPAINHRYQSEYSRRAAASKAMMRLLETLAEAKCTVILTFPAGDASNSLSGLRIAQAARSHFRIRTDFLPHVHSTLGGQARVDATSRGARKELNEILLTLTPR